MIRISSQYVASDCLHSLNPDPNIFSSLVSGLRLFSLFGSESNSVSICYLDPYSILFPSATWIQIQFCFHLLPGSRFISTSICYLDLDSIIFPSATWIQIHFYFHLLPGSRFNYISICYLDPDSFLLPSATWI